MKTKIVCFSLISAFIISLTLFTTQGVTNAKTIKWRMATGRTPALTPYHDADMHFAKLVNEMSGGRLQIKVYPAGELMGAFEIFDATRNGTIECATAWPTYWTTKNTAFDLLCSMGFMMTAPDYMTWLYQSGGLELGQDLYEQYNLKFFPVAITGPESGYRTNKKITSIEDFKGVKLRTGVLQNIWVLKQIGANPTRVPGSEVYMALKLGTIDGAEYGVPSCDWNMKFQEITDYWMTPAGWHQVGTVSDLMINMEAWNKLPDDLKKIVETAARANMVWSYAKANYESMEAQKKFEEAGVETCRLNKEAQEKLESLCVEYIEKEAAKNPDYAKIAKSIFSYLKEFEDMRKMEGRFNFGTNIENYPELEAEKE